MTTPVFPTLSGLGWPTKKSPKFATRTQKAVSGRQLRIVDQLWPIWSFVLPYNYLYDAYDTRGGAGPGTGKAAQLRDLMGFFLELQGSFGVFLYDDPSDDSAVGQALTPTSSTYAGAAVPYSVPFTPVFTNSSAVIGHTGVTLTAGQIVTFSNTGGALPTPLLSTGLYFVLSTGLTSSQFEVALTAGGSPITMTSGGSGTQAALAYSGGTGYTNGDIIYPTGGTYATQATFVATVVDGTVTALTPQTIGSYSVVPGTTDLATTTSGGGTGLKINVTWNTNTQLVRTLGGFTEPITAPNVVSNIYFNGVSQAGWTVIPDTGEVILGTPPGAQTITADFTYYFRCHFAEDNLDFENFMYQLWSAKEVKFESILL